MISLLPLDNLKLFPKDLGTMPKGNKSPKIIGTSSLKVKPKKRPGLIKQLSQPFFPSSKKSKSIINQDGDPVKLLSAKSTEDIGYFGAFDDMFLPNKKLVSENDAVFMSPEKEIETYLKFEKEKLTLDMPNREKCSSADSGYMSPPCPNEILSPTSSSTPAKGILKKMRSLSPDVRCESPITVVNSIDNLANGHVTMSEPIRNNRPMSPFERAMSPLGMEFASALDILDNVIEEESDKKAVKKCVSFGDIPEVKNFFSDSSDDNIDEEIIEPVKKSVSFESLDRIKQAKDTINEHQKACIESTVSLDDLRITSDLELWTQKYFGDTFMSETYDKKPANGSVEVEKSEQESCLCKDICQFEVEVKVIDIQPNEVKVTKKGEVKSDNELVDYCCRVVDKFNILICHHPSCTQLNENRPMLLCKECDNHIHQQTQYSGHLVLDIPKRKSNERNSKFVHTNSTPVLQGRRDSSLSVTSMDMEEGDEGLDEQDAPTPIQMPVMENEIATTQSNESPEMGEVEKKLKRKKVVKAKRRHTTGARSHSASDIFYGNQVGSDDEDENGNQPHRYSYHGSIDEQSMMTRMQSRDSSPLPGTSQAFAKPGKGTINHETFTLKIRDPYSDMEDIEIVAAEKNVSLREAIRPILERRGLGIDVMNVFVDQSNTPLPLNCETFLLGGTTMNIRQKDGDSVPIPTGSQSLSKATGSKLAGGTKGQGNKNSKSGMNRRESMIGRAHSVLEAPVSKQRRSSLQLPFQAFFPSPKLRDGSRVSDDLAGSLRSRRGINLSIDDSQFPVALSQSISPQGTLRENDNRKQKQTSKLTTLFSPMNKEKEKQEQLNELLNTYSSQGLPSPPSLVQIGQPQIDESMFAIESDWRTIVENSQDLTKRQHDQQEAIWELLQTELYYIRSLRVISDLFLCVLLNLQNELILNEVETERLFNNIGDIVTVNTEFWKGYLVRVLEDARTTSSLLNPSLLKPGFQKYYDMFQPYIQYCSRQKLCIDYMKIQYNDNELFKTFVIWAEAQKQCNRLKLTDLLVKPMQRLTKYSLLLQAILGKTDDERQRKDLLEMIGCVDGFVRHVNSTLRQQHEEEKLQKIVDKIEPYDAIEAPNDECLKIIQPYNSNFNLTAPMQGCDISHTRSLIMQSPLKMKEYQNRMDVECLLFTDLLLICKASKRMDKYKIVKPPMRVDRTIIHELKDRGSFLLIYVNEYHIPVSSFTFHGDQNAIQVWLNHIKKAQELYREARQAAESSSSDKTSFNQSEIISEEVIGYTPLLVTDPPLLQLTRCASEEPEGLRIDEDSSINRSRSWNEMVSMGSNSSQNDQVPRFVDGQNRGSLTSSSEPQLENVLSINNSSNHPTVQYSQSDPLVFNQNFGQGEERLIIPTMSISGSDSDTPLPDFVDESMKSKLYRGRQSRTEKRYYTADAIQELNKSQNRDNSIYKRLSWNFPNGEAGNEKQGVLKTKTMSSDSIRSFHSSSGVSSTGSLHLSPDGDICEEMENENYDSEMELNNRYSRNMHGVLNEDDLPDRLSPESHKSKSKSTSDIISLMQELNTRDYKDGISSVEIPPVDDMKKLSQQQIMRMKKQFLLSSNVEASEV